MIFDKFDGMNIFVSGGAGFIGSWVCETLLDVGARVVCVDNFLRGNWDNIRHMKNNPDFVPVYYDVVDPKIVEDFGMTNFDIIIHAASPASPADFPRIPINILDVNTTGTKNMLELARRGDSRFLLCSSSEVYGDPPDDVFPYDEEYRGNVSTVGVRSCFSADTELLTESGWKFFKDVNENDKILTINKKQKIEYQIPLEIIKEKYEGELIAFKNYQCDLLVTPNHRMYVAKRDDQRKERNFLLIPACESLNWDRSLMLKVASYDNDDEEYFYFPRDIDVRNGKTPPVDRIKMDDWLEFFGYYITEGCAYIRQRERKVGKKTYIINDYRILIAQDEVKNKQKCQKIRECLKRLPYKFQYCGHQFSITNKQLANYLKQFGKSREKYIPRELMNLSKRQLTILFRAMMLGDGYEKPAQMGNDGYIRRRGSSFTSSSYRLISDFQEILLKIGYAGNIKNENKKNKKPIYCIRIINRFSNKSKTPTYGNRHVENYNGFVYCVNVPNHVIFVRRNGTALFCGNCYDEGKRVAESYTMAYLRTHGVDGRIARIHNTYGERQLNDGRVVPRFVIAALRNNPLPVYGAGEQTRSFLYIEDLIDGLLRTALVDNIAGIPINLGSINEMKIIDLAEQIIDMTNSESKIISYDSLPDDPRRRVPSVKRAEELLKWKPAIDLDEGLRRTIDWWKIKLEVEK